ncbi:MAG TPA: hypothetical protein DC063_07915 [Arenimonas sp.]|nr:MAG: hypothetical protein A2X76_04215 [Xanthomonadales bacterium GWF1_69_6]HBD20005.1 hypothetical protein [Arenimonas sp.]
MDERDEWLTRLRMMRLAWPVRCQRLFTPEEMALLRQGLWPTSLEDRWVVWLDGGLLRVWRAWTGECIYEAEISEDETGAGQCRVLRVCDDADVYTRSSGEAGELDRFEGVLAMLLGRRKEAAA